MQQQNIKLALSIVLLLMSMLILSFASVPIYSLFCKATGFGGTTTRQESFLKPQKGIRKIKPRPVHVKNDPNKIDWIG
jgi:cytochrome c oxidase assembly protein subunit 11